VTTPPVDTDVVDVGPGEVHLGVGTTSPINVSPSTNVSPSVGVGDIQLS
jgi:hypothetical protein